MVLAASVSALVVAESVALVPGAWVWAALALAAAGSAAWAKASASDQLALVAAA